MNSYYVWKHLFFFFYIEVLNSVVCFIVKNTNSEYSKNNTTSLCEGVH